jgi:hypothetical protein
MMEDRREKRYGRVIRLSETRVGLLGGLLGLLGGNGSLSEIAERK